MLYILNKDLNTQLSIPASNDQVTVELANGNWDFVVLAWDGSTPMAGNLKCAQESATLTDFDTEINLTLSTTACDSDYFSPSAFRTGGQTKSLRLVNCQDTSTATSGSNCNSADRGFAESYKVKLLGHTELPVSNLGSVNLDQTASIESDCITSITQPSSITPANIKLPFGSPTFRPSVLIEAFSDSACSINKKKYLFEFGGLCSANIAWRSPNSIFMVFTRSRKIWNTYSHLGSYWLF